MSKINPGLMSSDRPDWNTPLNLLERVRAFDSIGLDPCGNAGSIVQARIEWRLERDGDSLPKPWGNLGLVYVNPPYGPEITPFAQKMVEEGAKGTEIIALLPARVDPVWWQKWITQADAVCFWRGRLKFLGAPSSAPFPSAVAYWGPRRDRFRAIFGEVGWVVSATPASAPQPLTLFAIPELIAQ